MGTLVVLIALLSYLGRGGLQQPGTLLSEGPQRLVQEHANCITAKGTPRQSAFKICMDFLMHFCMNSSFQHFDFNIQQTLGKSAIKNSMLHILKGKNNQFPNYIETWMN